jgi:hypothetical protein
VDKLILATLGVGAVYYAMRGSSGSRVLDKEEAEEQRARIKKREQCRQKVEYYQQHWRTWRRDLPRDMRSDAERDYQMDKITQDERNERFRQADEIYRKDVEKYNRSIDSVKDECAEFVGKIDFRHVGL